MAINLPIVSKFDDKGVNQAASSVDKLRGTLKTFATVALAAFSVDAIVDFGRSSIKAAEDAQVANARLDNISKSMGIFGDQTSVVTKRIQGFADSLALTVGIEDEVIKAAQAQLLTFKNLAITADQAGGAFDRATVAVLDLSAAGLGSLETSAVQLGKALQDPVKGLAALGRAGVTFTDEQKALIKSLVESNRTLEAQDMILSAIEQQVGGTAEATATASQKMSVAFGEIQETIGALLLPAFEGFAAWLVTNLPAIQKWFEETGAFLGEVFGNIAAAWDMFVVKPFQKFVDEHGPGIKKVFDEVIRPAFEMFVNNVLPVFLAVMGFLATLISDNVIATLENLADWFTDPANKNTIIFFTGLVAAMVAQFMLIPIIITAAIVAITTLLNYLSMALTKTREYLGVTAIVGGVSSAVSGSSIQAQRIPNRAAGGGAANAGLSWVGEKGPELISMPRGATVTPIPQHMRADAMFGANRGGNSQPGNYITINVNGGLDSSAQIGEAVVNAIRKYERTSGAVFARA